MCGTSCIVVCQDLHHHNASESFHLQMKVLLAVENPCRKCCDSYGHHQTCIVDLESMRASAEAGSPFVTGAYSNDMVVVGKEPVTPQGQAASFKFRLKLISTIGMLHVSIIFIEFSKGQGSMHVWNADP
jgi:hypothetical protein